MKKSDAPASSWEEVPALVDTRRAEFETVAYGITRSMCGNELLVDFGDELGEVAFAKITFRDPSVADAAYCKGIRIAIKVVEHPEHPISARDVSASST